MARAQQTPSSPGAEEHGTNKESIIADLGAAANRAPFDFAAFFGCRSIGFELVKVGCEIGAALLVQNTGVGHHVGYMRMDLMQLQSLRYLRIGAA